MVKLILVSFVMSLFLVARRSDDQITTDCLHVDSDAGSVDSGTE